MVLLLNFFEEGNNCYVVVKFLLCRSNSFGDIVKTVNAGKLQKIRKNSPRSQKCSYKLKFGGHSYTHLYGVHGGRIGDLMQKAVLNYLERRWTQKI